MKRTTIMVPDEIYDALRRMAEERGQKLSEVVRDALARYIDAAPPPKRRLTFIGKGQSGQPDLSLRIDEILGKLLEEEYRRG